MGLRAAWARGRQACWNYYSQPRPLVPRLLNLATWVPVMIWFKSSVVQIAEVGGESMYPTFNSNPHESRFNDRIINYKLNAHENLARGMIVTLSPAGPEVIAIKRIVGLEGDIVRTRKQFPVAYVQVPQGHVWVEGDAAEQSLDSNTYGPVSKALITGRVTHVILPWRKAGRVRWWEHVYPYDRRDDRDDER